MKVSKSNFLALNEDYVEVRKCEKNVCVKKINHWSISRENNVMLPQILGQLHSVLSNGM